MNMQKLILIFVLLLACSLTAAASDVYKRVNEDGVIEFSDRPSPDAQKIEVKPNVVETNPVTRPTPAASSTDTKATEVSSGRQSSANNESVLTRNQRERAARKRTRGENNQELVADPDPGRANRNAARAIGGP